MTNLFTAIDELSINIKNLENTIDQFKIDFHNNQNISLKNDIEKINEGVIHVRNSLLYLISELDRTFFEKSLTWQKT